MIEFTEAVAGSTDAVDYISFLSADTLKNLPSKTIIAWMTLQSTTYGDIFNIQSTDVASSTDEYVVFALSSIPTVSTLLYAQTFSSGAGLWRTTATVPTTTLSMVAVTYNNSSSDNAPIIYINGSSVAITTAFAPSGTPINGTNTIASISDPIATVPNGVPDMRLFSLCVYNRILSAAEILDAYNSRLAIPSYNGLVFAPDLRGAAGGVGDGSTLAAGNVIRDHISGASGTPAGSPVLRADNYLNYK